MGEPCDKRNANKSFVDAIISDFTGRFTRVNSSRKVKYLGYLITPVNTPGEYMNSEAARKRSFFMPIEHPILGRYSYAGPPYKLSATPARKERPAPLLGEHNEEIYCGELGLTRDELCGMKARTVI